MEKGTIKSVEITMVRKPQRIRIAGTNAVIAVQIGKQTEKFFLGKQHRVLGTL
jgi:hypothetical protein